MGAAYSDSTYIVIPAFNEERFIRTLISKIKKTGYHNVVIVDDGSSDQTVPLAQECGAIVLIHPINRGAGAATQTGIEYARRKGAKVVVTLDADLQHKPSEIEGLVKEVTEGEFDIVIGSRFLKENNLIPFSRRIFNRIGNYITFFLSGVLISDTQSGFKAFANRGLEEIDIKLDGFEFCTGIVIQSGERKFKLKEVPISVRYTHETMKKGQGLFVGVKTLFNLLVGAYHN